MKKIFNNPEVYIVKIQTCDILTTSLEVDNTARDNIQGGAPRRNVWDDDEDEY